MAASLLANKRRHFRKEAYELSHSKGRIVPNVVNGIHGEHELGERYRNKHE